MRQYLTLMHRRPKFTLGLIAIAALGVLCQIVAHSNVVHSPPDSVFRQLAGSLGDAFIIAAVLAVLDRTKTPEAGKA